MSDLFYGVFSPTVTGFNEDGSLSEKGTRDYVRFQIESGVHGLAPLGTAGEPFVLSTEERTQVLEWVLDEADDKVPVLAGTGDAGTETTVQLSLHAKNHGASGLMLITPYVQRPPRSGVLDHFRTVKRKTGLPIMLYNVPIVTGIEVPPDDLKLLHCEGTLQSVKWSHLEISRIQETIWHCGPNFPVFAGIDYLVFAGLALGCRGMICGLPMLSPRLARQLFELIVEKEDLPTARFLWMKIQPWIQTEYSALFSASREPHWLSVCRAVAELRGIKVGPPRPPLKRIDKDQTRQLAAVMNELGEL
jgi:dihydrodipicolinate synthase/N-acetylneuraminate lyase